MFLLLAGGGFELGIAADLFRPLTAAELTIGIDDRGIGRLLHRRHVLHAKTAEQDALRRIGLIQRQLHRHHLTGLQLASHGAGQQHAASLVSPGHGRPGAHALSQGRRRLQRHQQGLRWPGRQVDTTVQYFAIGAFDLHIEGQCPIHGVLQAQTHGASRGPVPATALRRQAQARLLRRVEGQTAENLTPGAHLGRQARQRSVLGGHLDHIHGFNEVVERLRRCRLDSRHATHSRNTEHGQRAQGGQRHYDFLLFDKRALQLQATRQ